MGIFITPKTFKPGVLDRRTEFGKLRGVPTVSESIPIVPRDEWEDALEDEHAANLDTSVSYILDQGNVGSCASESKDGMCAVILGACGQPVPLFNPYGTYGRVNDGRDNGSSLDDNLQFAMEFGCFPESVWPRSKGWKTRPNDAAYEEAAKYRLLEAFDVDTSSSTKFIEQIGSLLLQRIPVYCGIPGHAIFLVRLLNRTQARYVNSWRYDWGDNGRGTVDLTTLVRSYGAYGGRSMVESVPPMG